MPDKNSWRKKIKESDPEKYAAYLERQKCMNQKSGQEKKLKWQEEPHTRAMVIEHERQLALAKERQRRYWEKKREQNTRTTRVSKNTATATAERQSVKNMSAEEYREHKRMLVERCRACMWAQKKAAIQKKRSAVQATENGREGVLVHTLSLLLLLILTPPSASDTHTLPGPSIVHQPHCPPEPQPGFCLDSLPDYLSKLPQKFYNFTSEVKTSLRKKKASPAVYARIVKNLANPRTPEKRTALAALGMIKEKAVAAKRSLMSAFKVPKKHKKSKNKEGRVATAVKVFYTREDVSRILSHRRYSTKFGPAYVMNMTMLGAFKLFVRENPDLKLGYIKFTLLRPRNVRKLGAVDIETCLCLYCLNVRYKISAINRCLAKTSSTVRLPQEGQLLDFMLCPKPNPAEKWHKAEYVDGELLMIMDFAENRKAMYQSGVKSAHFAKTQITLHPIVAFYKGDDGQLLRHSLMYISDNIQHDYYAVHHFTVDAITRMKEKMQLSRVVIFSDGCPGQYKGIGTFADLSLITGISSVQRACYASEHGKGEADGETGVLSQALSCAVHGGLTVKCAADLHSCCVANLSKHEGPQKNLSTCTPGVLDQAFIEGPDPAQEHADISVPRLMNEAFIEEPVVTPELPSKRAHIPDVTFDTSVAKTRFWPISTASLGIHPYIKTMCEGCVKEEFPDRDSLCVDSGSYMINFVKCCDCESQDMKIVNRNCTESDDEERITYQHVCGQCSHMVAEHEHIFRVDDEFQHYEMSCLLCGSADDQRSIMPIDPRGPIM
ncbi:churchill [Plakobranchus ocellatus]|uniref:Churchill n=1 Tax=Plakobranchus ocellatus TaxID=259542 RepID=A0AAV4C254_9GAST|nr:churchill [Plakobranchus ocellatus]